MNQVQQQPGRQVGSKPRDRGSGVPCRGTEIRKLLRVGLVPQMVLAVQGALPPIEEHIPRLRVRLSNGWPLHGVALENEQSF